MTRRRAARETDTYWILDRKQILCLASSRRQDILDRLAASGPSSVREFAAAVGLAPSAVYHHLRRLEAAGLVAAAGTRIVRRRTEKLYAAVAPRMRLARALEQGRHREPLQRVVAALCRQMSRDFARAISRPGARADGPGRNLGFFRLVGSPDAATLAEINRHLDRVAELFWGQAGGGAPLVALGWTLAPVDGPAGRAGSRTGKP